MDNFTHRQRLLTVVMMLTVGAMLMALLMHHLDSYAAPTQGHFIPNNTAGDWSRYMFSDTHQGNNPSETQLSAANIASLTVQWKFTTSGHLVGEPTVVNGVVYQGSWDGYLYALNAATGKVLWKTNVGVYGSSQCSPGGGPGRGGPSGAAAVEQGMVYIGSGPHFYALNASSGAIVWQAVLGTSQTNNDHIWGSAAVANGKVYVGVASLCDHPLTQGLVYALNATTGNVDAQAAVVPSGYIGGGVWSTPTIDATTGTVIVTTGSVDPQQLRPLEAAVVTLDWNTMAVKQFWQIPAAQRINDADWGATPTLFPGPNGKTYFGCINKNSIYYVFDEANVSTGPIWEQQLGPGGYHGGVTGSIASSAYVNGILYIPTALATVNGTSYPGSIGAFDALTGLQLWRFGTAGTFYGSVLTANGLLYESQGNTFEVRDQSSGTVLFSYTLPLPIKASVTVSHGVVYVPEFGKVLIAFAAAQ